MTEVAEDVLAFWHPTLNAPLDEHYFQWGHVARSSSADRQFRMRNQSFLYTAAGITVSVTEIVAATRSVAAQHYLSTNGSTFTAALSIGNLAPRGITEILTLRRVVALDADIGDGDFQLLAHADEWR